MPATAGAPGVAHDCHRRADGPVGWALNVRDYREHRVFAGIEDRAKGITDGVAGRNHACQSVT